MKKQNQHYVFIAILFVITLVFFKNILQADVTINNVHYINDLTFVSYNNLESLKNNQLPLWTPYFYSGHPLIAIPENYLFDLNFLLLYVLRDIYMSMNIALILYFFIAGLGMYLLAYALVENKKAAFVSAIVFMFNGFMHSFILSGNINILEGYALIPFIFLFVHKALKLKEWVLYSVLAGIFFALQILSGSLIIFFYTVLIILLYFIFNLIGKNLKNTIIRSFFVGLIIIAVCLSLAAIKLLPSIEFTKMSSRSAGVSFQEFLGQPVKFGNFIGTFVTDFKFNDISGAAGIFGTILLIFGLINYRKKIVLFSIILISFSVLFASGTFIADAMFKVPGFSSLRHVERALMLFVFPASILSAYGFVYLSDMLKNKNYFKNETLIFVLILVLLSAELVFLHNFPSAEKVVKPDDIKLLDYISKDNSKFRTINLMNDVIGAAGYNYYAQKGISEAKGGGGIWINDYAEYLAVAQQYLSPKLLGILNVKYVVSGKQIDSSGFSFVEKFNECQKCVLPEAFGPYLYKNDQFIPRYYVVPNSILVVGDARMAKQLVYALSFQNWNPKNTAIVEGTEINDYSDEFLSKFDAIILLKDSADETSIPKLKKYKEHGTVLPDITEGKNEFSAEDVNALLNKTKEGFAEVSVNNYQNNKVVLELNGHKGWLVASERFAHFPGWKASADGKEMLMVKADIEITAAYLDGEKGKLTFEYYPDSYREGKWVTLIAVFLILVYFCYFIYNKKSNRGDKNKT